MTWSLVSNGSLAQGFGVGEELERFDFVVVVQIRVGGRRDPSLP